LSSFSYLFHFQLHQILLVPQMMPKSHFASRNVHLSIQRGNATVNVYGKTLNMENVNFIITFLIVVVTEPLMYESIFTITIIIEYMSCYE
ncbi:hypothetical protein A4A49_53957, partial [Nicotiana attenuata]